MFSWLKNFRIDHLSFWLGFVTAGIALWLYKKIKASLPKIQKIKDKGIEVALQHQLSADEIYYNLNVLETAQGQHLTGSFFPLDTIIIPPLLLPPSPLILTPQPGCSSKPVHGAPSRRRYCLICLIGLN